MLQFITFKISMVTRLKDVLRNMCKNKLDQNDHSSNSGCMNRGECFNGSCICEIRFSGEDCESYNSSYHAGKHSNTIKPDMDTNQGFYTLWFNAQ